MVKGKPRIQRQMAMWYEKFRLPEAAERKYQYSIFDRVQVERATHDVKEAIVLSRAMPRIDLLAWDDKALHIVELKKNAQLSDVGQVLQYARYVDRDIFLEAYRDLPRKLVLVSTVENGSVRAACQAEGIEYITIPLTELPDLPE